MPMKPPTRSFSDSRYARMSTIRPPRWTNEGKPDVDHERQAAERRQQRSHPHQVHRDQGLGVGPGESERLPRRAVTARPVHADHEAEQPEAVEVRLPPRKPL